MTLITARILVFSQQNTNKTRHHNSRTALLILKFKKILKYLKNVIAFMVGTDQSCLDMLRQTIRHRIISRITFYTCVIGLLWLMDRATEAHQRAMLDQAQPAPIAILTW